MHEKRIARGARFLDRKTPDWYRKITRPPSMTDRGCVIGQVYGNFADYMDHRYFIPSSWEYSDSRMAIVAFFLHPGTYMGVLFSVRHGFIKGLETDKEWGDAWKQEIQVRFDRDRKKDKPLFVPEEWAKRPFAATDGTHQLKQLNKR